MQEWGWLLDQVSPGVTKDEFAPVLADRLAAISRAGVDARQLVRSAACIGGPLPDDHAAAALWWRISRHLTAVVAAHIDTDHTHATTWTFRLAELLGAERADALQSSRCGHRWLLQSATLWSAVGDSTTSSKPPAGHKTGLVTPARRCCGASQC
jgi:hypothetical protein